MSDYTVMELAKKLNVSPEVLLKQLQQAGIACQDAKDVVTSAQVKMLSERLSLGDEAKAAPARARVHIKRKSEQVLQTDGDKTVTVVTKKRRRLVKRPASTDGADTMDETTEINMPSNVVITEEKAAPSVESEPMDKPVVEDVVPAVQAISAEASEQASLSVSKEQSDAEIVTPSEPIVETTPEETPVKDKKASLMGIQMPSNVSFKPVSKAKAPVETQPEAAPIDADNLRLDMGGEAKTTTAAPASEDKRPSANKKKKVSGSDDKKGWSKGKKTRSGRKSKDQRRQPASSVENKHAFAKPTAPMIYDVQIPETITVGDLAQRMSMKAALVIKELMKLGVMATINQSVDRDTATLVVEELGHKAVSADTTSLEDVVKVDYDGEAVTRAPIVTIMGHVDHGKTSLLDAIRVAKVAAGEAGGITQHIGAYHVKTAKGMVSFLDTPGHAAFTAMRARGAQVTDIVIVVVAADDGVKPQTVEAIQHAKAAGVPMIIAVNKMDKPGVDLDRVKTELSQHEVIPEDWGGDVQFVPVSAKAGTGLDDLLDSILLQAEVMEIKAYDKGPASGVIIESRLDKGRGPIATVLVKDGQLKLGDIILCGCEYGRVRAMIDERGQSIKQAGPAIPVEILGLSGVPGAGEGATVVKDDKMARELSEHRKLKRRENKLAKQQAAKLKGFMDKMTEGDVKTLNIVLKADVQGSVEAITDMLEKLSTEEVRIQVVAKGVGAITESDVNLALASEGLIIGFNVRADAAGRKLASQEDVELNYYSVVYDIMDNMKAAMTGMLSPRYQDKIIGLAEVRDVFRSAKWGAIAGCIVSEGLIKRNRPIRVLRDSVVIYEGELESLRRHKDDVNDVRQGIECGIGVKNYNDVKAGDQIEVFESVKVAPELSSTGE